MITIADCSSWQECQLLKSKLESAGIPVFVPDEMSNSDGLILHFGGFRIQVVSILGAAPVAPKTTPVAKGPTKPKRKMSAAARASMSKWLKARWAKVKAAEKKAL